MNVMLLRLREGARSTLVVYAACVAVASALLYAIPFSRVPFALIDLHRVLLEAQTWWWTATIYRAFTAGVEYRPLFTIVVKAMYSVAGLHLWFYKFFVLAQFAAIQLVFLLILQPASRARAFAAGVALLCLLGLPSTRILFSFFPLNHHSLSILIVLTTAWLALRDDRRFDWVIPPLAFAGMFLIEFGLLTPLIITALHLWRARGASRRATLGTWVALGVYLCVRFTIGNQEELGLTHGETGLGFSQAAPEDLENIFEHAPYLFWIYNVIANIGAVVAAEPRAGIYAFLYSLIRGVTKPWQWLQVISSVSTTALVVVWCRSDTGTRDRQLAALGVALMVFGGGLGAFYARDRIGLPVGIGYAVLFYLALARLAESRIAGALKRVPVQVVVVGLVAAWAVRDVELWYQVKDTAWERHIEWTDRFEDLGGKQYEGEPLMEQMRSQALRMTPSQPRDPEWTWLWLERRGRPPS